MGKNIEIELKAHAGDYRACKNQLDTLAGAGIAFSKDDAYWFLKSSGELSETALSTPALRVRREKTGNSFITRVNYKTKERRDGIEINDEYELEVSDGDCFETLLTRLGLVKRIYKNKRGWSWNCEGITAELAEVRGLEISPASIGGTAPKNLGWFLELEILTEDAGTVAAAREGLLELLEKAGLKKEAIESRYYSELLTVT
jgi:adenylate cyclase class 2